ncbi:dipeptide epimerase [Natrialba sp. SSL1]|uniref:dipeptide epimerase n=1 Tax=Natrialba sp. SSL1 TaxID=1869245 RepID=UPI0008F884C8|nr:dipeptide epimerase [Natrialba sp. SSL1]OIB58940.1 dipeptide epimerase [Natrialba sp. SSL1]
MTRITDVSVTPFNHPLEEPFEIALGKQTEAANLLATVQTEDGTEGYGEGSPIPPVTGETQASAMAVVREMSDLIEGEPLTDFRRLSSDLKASFPSTSSARLAIETAVIDARCRELEIPMAELFGGTSTPVETDMTVPIVDTNEAETRAAAAAAEGYKHLKVKAGSSVKADIDRMLAVAEGAPGANLKVDANQGWTVAQTVRFAEAMRDHGLTLDLIEQPVHRDDIRGLEKASRQISEPIAADESLFSPSDAIRLVREGAVDVMNLKLGKSGLVDALAIIDIAEAANVDLMIGCMLESAVAIHTAAHVVAGTDAFSYVDLDGNRLLDADVIEDTGPMIDISGPGHGVDTPIRG